MIGQNVQNEVVLFGVSSFNNIIIKTGKLKSTLSCKQSITNVFITALASTRMRILYIHNVYLQSTNLL